MIIIEKEKDLTLEDMTSGDSFVIRIPGWDSVYLMCDNNTFVKISTGETYNVHEENEYFPVHKIDFILTEK